MADATYYEHPYLANARTRVDDYKREAAKRSGAYMARPRSTTAQAVHLAEILGGGAVASYVSGRSGPEGATAFGVPVELLIGGGLGAVAAVLALQTNPTRDPAQAGKNEMAADHLFALGAGAIAAYTNRFAFERGLASAKPPQEASGSQVSGVPPSPSPMVCYLPAPMPWMLPAPTQAPMMAPPMLPAQAAAPAPVTIGESMAEYFDPSIGEESIGADEIDRAAEILDRMNRR